MADKINDGGAAFPTDYEDQHPATTGMSLRDWFAGQAVQAVAVAVITADRGELAKAAKRDGYDGTADGYIGFRAYRIADAIIAEREKANG